MGNTEREAAAVAPEAALSLDRVFALLADRRRRYALYYLFARSEGVATVDELATAVRTLEECTSDRVTERTRIRTALRHAHLPKLEDAGVLEHDARSETVRYWRRPAIEEWLEHAFYTELPSEARTGLEGE